MRKTLISVGLLAVALVVTGLAAAKLKSTGVQPATATFTTAMDNARSSTCVGNGDTYRTTVGRYVGKIDFAAPNDDLDGTLTMSLRAVYNATDRIGWVEGAFRSHDEGKRPNGTFRGVLGDSGGQLTMSGFANGSVNRRYARLLGTMSAALKVNETGLVTAVDGALGQGAASFPAALVGSPCRDEKTGNSNRVVVKLTVKGTIQTLSADSITVNPVGADWQTCFIKAGTSPSLDGYAAGQKIEMGCGIVDSKMTLLKLKRKS